MLVIDLCSSLVSARRRSLLVAGLCLLPISLLLVTQSLYSLAATSPGCCCLRFALPLALISSDLLLSLSHALGSDLQVVGLYKGFDLGIFWWVCDLVLGGGFVIWFWMSMVYGGLVVVGLLVAAMVEVFFFFLCCGWWW